jgi:hypothetical protein
MKWVVQSNLVNSIDHDRIKEACAKYGHGFESVQIVPFSPDLPAINSDCPTVFYGATNFITSVFNSGRWKPGAFFSHENFTVRAYVEHYRERMLNYPCIFTTIADFAASRQPLDKSFFIRPNKDMKEFAGDVMYFEAFQRWERNLRHLPGCSKHPALTVSAEIVVSDPCGIAHEWRVFVVKGRVSTGSHYREYGRLTPRAELPSAVVDFVEGLCKVWTPADAFVMDVGESAGNLYVVECNCINSAGFYLSDVEKIVADISVMG